MNSSTRSSFGRHLAPYIPLLGGRGKSGHVYLAAHEYLREQCVGHGGAAHRRAGVAGHGLLDDVGGQHSHGVDCLQLNRHCRGRDKKFLECQSIEVMKSSCFDSAGRGQQQCCRGRTHTNHQEPDRECEVRSNMILRTVRSTTSRIHMPFVLHFTSPNHTTQQASNAGVSSRHQHS